VTHVPEDGPLGLEGRHQLKGGDQMPPGANNEYSVYMYGSHQFATDAWIKIDRITGLHGLGDGDDFREPLQGGTGEVVYPGAQRGKTVVYEGRVVGTDLPKMRQLATELRRAAAETRERVTGSVTIVDPAAPTVGFATGVRCIAFDEDDEQALGPTARPSPWQRPFSLGLRMHDPRFIWYPQEASEDNDDGDTVVLSNDGNAPVNALYFDVIASSGSFNGQIIVENLTLGVQLQFDDILLASGNLLRIDFTQRAATQPQNIADPPEYTPNDDMMPYLNVDQSEWWAAMEWGLGPGNNSVRVTTDAGDLTWSVWWHHTSY